MLNFICCAFSVLSVRRSKSGLVRTENAQHMGKMYKFLCGVAIFGNILLLFFFSMCYMYF